MAKKKELRKPKPQFKETKVSPRPVTPEQKQDISKQKAERGRPKPTAVETRRVGTREEVVALEDRPGKEPQPLPPLVEEPIEKTPFGILEESPENIAFRERLKEPLTVGEVIEATAWGLGIAAGGIGLAGLGISGAVAGSGMSAVTNAAGGKFVKETGKVILGKAALNTKNAGKTISLFSKLTKNTRALAILGGYAFSTHLSLNDRSDTIMSLGIALNNAQRAGDLEKAKELMEVMEEVDNAGTIIEAFAPLVNYPLAAIRKARLTVEAGRSMIKVMEDPSYTPTPQEEAKRKEADEYWAEILGRTPEEIRAKTFEAMPIGGATKVIKGLGKGALTNKFVRQNYDEFLDFFIKKAGKKIKITEEFIRKHYDEALDALIKKLK